MVDLLSRPVLRKALMSFVFLCTMGAVAAAQPAARPAPEPAGLSLRHCANPAEYASQGPLEVKLHINQLKGAWGFSRVGEANKDGNGYPLRLVNGPATSRILHVSPDLAGIAPYTGRFRLYGRGTGSIQIGHGRIVAETATIRLPRRAVGGQDYWHVDFDYDPTLHSGPVSLDITALPVRGDHIRDLALVHESHLAAFEGGQRFMPEIVADLSLFGHGQPQGRGALRFMQSLQVNAIWRPDRSVENGYRDQTGATRDRRFVSRDHYSFPRIQNNGRPADEKLIPTALPIADIVDLVNATGTDLWYNLSADILDGRAAQIAAYVRDNLDPDRRVYWEYGNELWNAARGYENYRYARAQGMATFPELAERQAVYEWDVYRSMQLFAIIRDVFAEAPGRAQPTPRYVATFFALEPSATADGRIIPDNYGARYFAAHHARQRPDIGALPEEIITDMAVGGYFGQFAPNLASFLRAQYPDDLQAQAGAFARLMEIGLDAGLVSVGRKQIDRPHTGVDPRSDVGVHHLIKPDIAAGLDRLGGLGRVLRLQDTRLQYRPLDGGRWRDVLEFAHPPAARSVDEMVAAGQITGLGRRFYGQIVDGPMSGIANVVAYRIAAHRPLADRYGLDLLFYESGIGNQSPAPGPAREIMHAYHDDGWAAQVMGQFLPQADAAGVRMLCWYKSHNRFPGGDFWGLKSRVGQPVAQAVKWKLVADSIALGRERE